MECLFSAFLLYVQWHSDDEGRRGMASERDMLRIARLFWVFPAVTSFNLVIALHSAVTGWDVIFRQYSFVQFLVELVFFAIVMVSGRPRILTPPFTRGW